MPKQEPILFEDISDEIKAKCDSGVYCPHCGKWAKKYRRAFNSEMSRFLIRLYNAQQRYNKNYTTRELYPTDNKANTSGVDARHWELIDVAEAHNIGGAPTGSFSLTNAGRQFVMGLKYIHSHAVTYNGELLGLTGDLVNIYDTLGTKFNYDNLMAGR